ncbi:hypothetical protein ACLMJK_003141 [Lecanora helva]
MPAAIQPSALPSEVLMIAETQWLFTEAELQQTPSILAGLSPEIERENRSKGVNFILQVGIMLKLPQITLSTASVFLHRFYMRHPMKWPENAHGFHHYEVGATSLFLATKVEENCRKMKELVIACCRVAQKDPHKLVDEQDKEYWRWRDVILLNEDVMLEAICFDLSLEPPYKTLYEHLVFFREDENKRLRNAAWAFVNDSYLSVLCLLFPSRVIATSALYAAAKHCGVTFPDDHRGRPWWSTLGIDGEEMRRACNYMASVYEDVPSKASSHGGLYERLEEQGDDTHDKTRAAASAQENLQISEERSVNGTIVSPAPSDTSEVRGSKRPREEQEVPRNPTTNGFHHETNGHSLQSGEHYDNGKRQKLDSNAISNGANSTNSPKKNDGARYDGITSQNTNQIDEGGGLVSPKLDEGSEEGEVEA